MFNATLIADFLDVEDNVVGIFLEAVVDAGAEVGLGPVVIDAQAAADVDVFQTGAESLHLGINAHQFDDRVLDVADVVNLAAQVEVQQVHAVAHAMLAEIFQGIDDLSDEQAKLRSHAARLFPSARAFGRKFKAHDDRRLDVVKLGVFDDQFEFAEFLDDGNDVLANLGGEDDRLDEFIIFEAVADD